MARKPVSAVTRAKISAALVGNKNAFQGGPKQKISKRTQVSNINSRTREKAAAGLLTADQVARRQAVAKRLRHQARREEALGKGPGGAIPQMGSTPSGTSPNPRRIKTHADEVTRRTSTRSASQKSTRAKNNGVQLRVQIDRTGHELVGGLPDRTSPRRDQTGLAAGGSDRSRKTAIQSATEQIANLQSQRDLLNSQFARGQITNKERLSRFNSISNQIEQIRNGGKKVSKGITPKLTGSAARIDQAVRIGTVKKR